MSCGWGELWSQGSKSSSPKAWGLTSAGLQRGVLLWGCMPSAAPDLWCWAAYSLSVEIGHYWALFLYCACCGGGLSSYLDQASVTWNLYYQFGLFFFCKFFWNYAFFWVVFFRLWSCWPTAMWWCRETLCQLWGPSVAWKRWEPRYRKLDWQLQNAF